MFTIQKLWITIIFITPAINQAKNSLKIDTYKISNTEQVIYIHCSLSPQQVMYKDLISFSTNHPDITISSWLAHNNALSSYDPLFRDTKFMFKNNVTLSVNITTPDTYDQAYLYVCYYQSLKKKFKLISIPIIQSNLTELSVITQEPEVIIPEQQKNLTDRSYPISFNTSLTKFFQSIQKYTRQLVHHSIILLIIIIMVFCMAILPALFNHYNKNTHTRISEMLMLLSLSSWMILFYICLYLSYHHLSLYIILPSFMCLSVFFTRVYIKKSMTTHIKWCHALYTFYAGITIVTLILLIAKTVQALDLYW